MAGIQSSLELPPSKHLFLVLIKCLFNRKIKNKCFKLDKSPGVWSSVSIKPIFLRCLLVETDNDIVSPIALNILKIY